MKLSSCLINYIYKPLGSHFFPAPRWEFEDEDFDQNHEEEEGFNPNVIHCPQKFFDLLDLAEKYKI